MKKKGHALLELSVLIPLLRDTAAMAVYFNFT